jgi:hypothetical protein
MLKTATYARSGAPIRRARWRLVQRSRPPIRYTVKRACELSCSRELLRLYRQIGDGASVCGGERKPLAPAGTD